MAVETAPVTETDVTEAEMERHIARWRDQKSTHAAFIDTRIPGHEREIWSIIGTGNMEDPNLPVPPIPAQDFNLAIVRADPGKGAALHSHLTQEVFMPLTGRWEVYWGPKGDKALTLGPKDVISLPVHLMRGFRNAGDGPALLLAVVGGHDPGKVGWPEATKEAARNAGVELDVGTGLMRDGGGGGGTPAAGAQGRSGGAAVQVAPVTEIDISVEEMERRHVARFADQKSTAQAFIDTKIPGHERDIWFIIGHGNKEDPSLSPPIPAQDFHMAMVRADPGKGAALHSHLTQEVFMPLTGRWEVTWGPKGERSATLEPYDLISVPVNLMRGFRNVGTEPAFLFAAHSGRDPGKVGWPEATKEAARRAGLELDPDTGHIREVQPAK